MFMVFPEELRGTTHLSVSSDGRWAAAYATMTTLERDAHGNVFLPAGLMNPGEQIPVFPDHQSRLRLGLAESIVEPGGVRAAVHLDLTVPEARALAGRIGKGAQVFASMEATGAGEKDLGPMERIEAGGSVVVGPCSLRPVWILTGLALGVSNPVVRLAGANVKPPDFGMALFGNRKE
jgi:hypothetical protein